MNGTDQEGQLKRIADALERIAVIAERWAEPIRLVVPDDQVMSQNDARRAYGVPPVPETPTQYTRGPGRIS